MGGLHLPTDEGMFRRAAIEERALAAEPTPVLEVAPPWTWAATLAVVAALVLGAWALLRLPVAFSGRGVALETDGGAWMVVALVPERERASLETGDRVEVETDAAHQGGALTLQGQVTAIGAAPLAGPEAREILGDAAPAGPVYRVDVAGPGSIGLDAGRMVTVTVRFRPRRQTLGVLVFEPARPRPR